MEKIKLFYAADLHGDLDSLKIAKEYLDKTKFDITIISGDYIHLPFKDTEIEDYMEPREKGKAIMQKFIEKKNNLLIPIIEQYQTNPRNIEREIPPDMVKRIQEDQITDMDLYAIAGNAEIPLASGIRSASMEYSKAREGIEDEMKKLKDGLQAHEEKYTKIAEANMQTMYEEIKKIMTRTDYLALPGNHDGKCLEEIMKEESLHKKVKEVGGLKIAGYGGAAIIMPIVPSVFTEFIEREVEQNGNRGVLSEPMIFLLEKSPDIAVTHEVPLGAIPGIGNQGLGVYVAKKKPALVLAAHMHEFHGAYPFQTNDKTILVMPGKLGLTEENTERYAKLRTFAEIELTQHKKELKVDKVTIKNITSKDEIKTLSEHYTDEL